MIDTQIKASLWRRSRTDFNTSKNNIVDFYFLQQNNFSLKDESVPLLPPPSPAQYHPADNRWTNKYRVLRIW